MISGVAASPDTRDVRPAHADTAPSCQANQWRIDWSFPCVVTGRTAARTLCNFSL